MFKPLFVTFVFKHTSMSKSLTLNTVDLRNSSRSPQFSQYEGTRIVTISTQLSLSIQVDKSAERIVKQFLLN